MKFRQHLLFIIEIEEPTRLESGVMKEIIPKAFPIHMHDKHNEAYMTFTAACKDGIVGVNAGVNENNWPLYFDSAAMLDKRIKFPLGFIDDQIEYELFFHRIHSKGNKSEHCAKNSDQVTDHTNFLIDKREAWKCAVCKTGHPNPKTGKPRPWYFRGTCLMGPLSKGGFSEKRE